MKLHLKNELEEIPPAADAAEASLLAQGASADAVYAARLVIEELVSNTIKYAYQDSEPHEILLDLRIQEGTMVLEVSDDGHPFNPLEAQAPDLSLPAADRPIGGLGLHLVRSMTDSLTYARKDGRNIVTIQKSLS